MTMSPETYALAKPSSLGAHSSRRSALREANRARNCPSAGPELLPSQ